MTLDERLSAQGAIKDAEGSLRLCDYKDLISIVEDEVELAEGREGLQAAEEIPDGVRRWKDPKGSGWIACHPSRKLTRWFNKSIWRSWRMAFLLAKLQRELWAKVPKAPAADEPQELAQSRRGRPPGKAAVKAAPKPKREDARGRGRGRGRGRPVKGKVGRPQGTRGLKRPAAVVAESPAASPVSAIVPVAVAEAHRVRLRLPKFRGQETLLGGRHRGLALFNLRSEKGREALVGLMKDGFTVLRKVFDATECDLAVDKIWDFAVGRCPALDPKDESTWNNDSWSAVVRGRNLCHLYGAGWVLWQERLRFRERLVEMGVYADVPHHVSWDGFHLGRPTEKPWTRSAWDHTDQVLLNGESTGCTWIQGLVALNDMDLSDGPAFECWPGSHQDAIFMELHKTEGLCETPNGSFRVLQDSGRGWLQGKGLKRQRVPISQGDVILWDSRLVHQGGAPASARASRAVAPCGQRHRGCYGRMVSYMCLGLAEFTPPSVMEKRQKSYEAKGDAVTLNHKPDAFEAFKKSRFHANSPPMAFPEDLPPAALQLHGLA
eukprot:symbB.v1.2.019930.t1/scaffold1652.1/size121070/10